MTEVIYHHVLQVQPVISLSFSFLILPKTPLQRYLQANLVLEL